MVMPSPSLSPRRLNLRPFRPDDLTAFHQVLNEDAITRYFPNPNPPSLERVAKLIDRQLRHWSEYGYGWWAVEPKTYSGKFIGWAGLQYLPETCETEVAYLLSKTYWGRGLASEAAWASLSYGFDRLDLVQIVGIVHPENIAS